MKETGTIYPNISFMIDAEKFLAWSRKQHSHRRLAEDFHRLQIMLINGEFEEAKKFPFVAKIIKGRPVKKMFKAGL